MPSSITNPKILTNGYHLGSQAPLDDRLVFKTTAEAIDLGIGDAEAYRYYEGMRIWCLDVNKEYVWQESVSGLITGGFTYAAGTNARGIDYSSRTFNFVETGYVAAVFPSVYTSSGDILALTPLVKTISASVDIIDISVYDAADVDISDAIHVERTVAADTVTLSSNIDLFGVQIKILYIAP